MALANFINKAALAASHVLKRFDNEGFFDVLNANVVGVFFDDNAAISQEGRVTLSLTVDLLSRLYPRLAIIPVGNGASTDLATFLEKACRAINPDIEIVNHAGAVTVGLVIGSTRAITSVPCIYVGSDGWIVSLSSESPVTSGSSPNPFGSSAAACFGAANVFRVIFANQLSGSGIDTGWQMSLLDLKPHFAGKTEVPGSLLENPEWAGVNLDEVHLVGIGAIGSSAIWALSRSEGLTGRLHVIDAEEYDLTNLQRYVGTHQEDIGKAKTGQAALSFPTDGLLEVVPHAQKWDNYLNERQDWMLDYVAVALDSAEDRCKVQAALPRRIVNSWTQTGDLGISRHRFSDDQACLMCLYLPVGKQKGRHELIAEAIGLPDAGREIAQLLYHGAPIGPELIARIAGALSISPGALADYAQLPISVFYEKAICGGTVLTMGGKAGGDRRAAVPMAFQSALAGILLAAEIMIDAGRLRHNTMPTTTKIDLLRPLGKRLSLPEPMHPSGKCICQDADYVDRFNKKYASSNK